MNREYTERVKCSELNATHVGRWAKAHTWTYEGAESVTTGVVTGFDVQAVTYYEGPVAAGAMITGAKVTIGNQTFDLRDVLFEAKK